MKMLVFDMDGTIADLYTVKNLFARLDSGDPTPYTEAKPMYDMVELNALIVALKSKGWTVAVTTWLAMNSDKEYDKKVKKAKKLWLERYSFPYDELHIVKYGKRKQDYTKKKGGVQILIDDNQEVRDSWTIGATIDATKDITKELVKILIEEYKGE